MEITTISFWGKSRYWWAVLLVGILLIPCGIWLVARPDIGYSVISITGLVLDHTRNLATYHSERHQPQGTGLGLVARRWHFRHTDRFLACQQSGSKRNRTTLLLCVYPLVPCHKKYCCRSHVGKSV